MTYKIKLTEEAIEMLAEIQDKRVRSKLFERIQKLSDEPEKQGKPLVDELHGYRSIRAIGQRYRIIYQIQSATIFVLVVGVGIRKEGQKKIDIYQRSPDLNLFSPPICPNKGSTSIPLCPATLAHCLIVAGVN